MKLTKKQQNSFKNNGYLVIKNFFSKEQCSKVIKIINQINKKKQINELDKDHPFSKINSKSKVIIFSKKKNFQINKIIKPKKILDIASKIKKTEMKEWFKKLYLKNAFDGDNEFYHQDYAYHFEKKAKNKDYLQLFVAFQNHTVNSGCLRVFKGSHKIGLIKHHSVMTRNGLSKLTPKSEVLKKIAKKYDLINLELKAGSCVFFDYLLLHGSSSNASEYDQIRMVYQMLAKNNTRDDNANKGVWKKRNSKELNILNKIINYKKLKGGKKVN